MLARMRRRAPGRLVGMQPGAAALESGVGLPPSSMELPHNPAAALLGIYPKDTKLLIRRGSCAPMFIAALSTTAKV